MTDMEFVHAAAAELEQARAALEAGHIGQAICHAAMAHKWLGYARGRVDVRAWPALDLICEAANEVTHQICQVADGRRAIIVTRMPRGALSS